LSEIGKHLAFICLPAAFCAAVFAVAGLPAANAQKADSGTAVSMSSMPGEVQPEPSTFHSISLRWPVLGDGNRNARVTLQYRKADEEDWHEGYPLFRPLPERMSEENLVAGGWLFAGSVVDLKPASDYVVRLTLSDPDGVSRAGGKSPEVTREQRISTRGEAREPAGLRKLFVQPRDTARSDGGDGSDARPFNGLRLAEAAAQPGDLITLRSGIYHLSDFKITRSGQPGHPVIYRGLDGAVLDGGGAEVLLNAGGTAHRWFENLELRNAGILLRADTASEMVVRRNRFHMTQYGVSSRGATYADSRHNSVTDNVFLGATKWPRSKGIEEVYGVELTGSGHVIAHNLFRNVGDAVHNGDRGRMSASDIYGNEIVTCTDDGIETDYSDTNVRVFRNRITNCYAGVTGQPVRGGPVYIFRNIIFNTQYSPFKLHNDTSGLLLFHNTSVRAGSAFSIMTAGETVSNVVTRNNLFVGTRSPALYSNGHMFETDFDNDGYAWGIGAGDFAVWNAKRYRSLEDAKASKRLYRNRGAYSLYAHRTFRKGFLPPRSFEEVFEADDNQPLLGLKSQAVDKGSILPNFNDRFGGEAPDLGCCEHGESLPLFGPRPFE